MMDALPFHRVLILLASLAALLAAASCSESGGPADDSTADRSEIPFVESEEHWQQLLADSNETLLVTEFYAEWCDPCRQLAPILESLATRFAGKTLFFRIDVDVHRNLARRYRVRGIPYTIIVSGGEVVDSLFGLQPAASYRKSIEKQLEKKG